MFFKLYLLIVDSLSMIRRIAFNTKQAGSFDECLSECLEYLLLQTREYSLLGVVFFIDASHTVSFQESYQAIALSLGKKTLALPFNVVAQPGIRAVSIECWLENNTSITEYLVYEGIRYTRVQSEIGASIFCFGLHHQNTDTALQLQVDESFKQLFNLLLHEGFSLSDIIRQWNYVPGIVGLERSQDKTVQHYQIFNEVRKHWYGKALFEKGYPAATGIGVKAGPFSIDIIATKLDASIHQKGLSNPRQENAYQYSQQHLIGDVLYGECKHPPLFERAKLLAGQDKSIVLVSGTAAILGQDTVGVGDLRKQLEISFNNMLELTTQAVTGSDATFQFNYLRIYMKYIEFHDTVKAMCELFFPNVSATFVMADICRDNLLMEIEGDAVT